MISLPYQERIGPSNDQRDYITFLLVGQRRSKAVDAIRAQFEKSRFFWLMRPAASERVAQRVWPRAPTDAPGRADRLQQDRPGGRRADRDRAGPDRRLALPLSARPDDPGPEPARDRATGRSLAGRAVRLRARGALRPNGQMFFLGAGFMLLETKGVVHMALLFGSTWIVNSIVFFAILTMILLSNFYVLALKPRVALAVLCLAGSGAGRELLGSDEQFSGVAGPVKNHRLVQPGLHPCLLRRGHLRDLVSRECKPGCRFRVEYRRHHPWRLVASTSRWSWASIICSGL